MAEQRKISVRKILQMITTIIVSTGCVVAMVSASSIEDEKPVKDVAIHIRNDKKYHFIEQNEIMDLAINHRKINLARTPMSKLDIHGMEKVLLADPWVASAEVYIDNERILHMYVTQRIPVARLFQQDKSSYYIDSTMSIMPLSKNTVYYTTIVTNVPDLLEDSASNALKKRIVTLVRNIQADSFWNAQISQVIVDSAKMFQFIPVLGEQKILFGDLDGMKDKFSNLFAFYKNVLNRIGWDKYETLDLRFKGQVIASPAIPYTGPVDKAAVTMNWINSIVEVEAKSDSKDSVKDAIESAEIAKEKAKQPSKENMKILARPPKKVKLKEADVKDKKHADKKQADKKQADKKQVDKKHPKEEEKAKGKQVNNKDKAHPADPKNAKDKSKDSKAKDDKDHNEKKAKEEEKKAKDKNIKDKNGTQAAPKYVYPDKKK